MIKEVRTLNMENLRNLCINKIWYTHGNIEEYDNLLNMTEKENITTNDIIEIATDIKQHSDTEYEITSICFEVARICYSHFEIE